MLNSLENSSVTYEDLAEIEQEFDDVEKEIIRQEIVLSAPVYARRSALTSKIPNFWPLVFEQAPPEIDQHIQIGDGALFLGALTSLSVTRFEPEVDPRSVLIRFEFAENKHFEDKILEKKFWWRTARNKSWCGLVSEAVGIRWKSPEVDLTEGLLDLVLDAESSIASKLPSEENAKGRKSKTPLTDAQKKLQQTIQEKGINGLSFFTWFGFIGNRISAKESAEAEIARRKNDALESLDNVNEEDDYENSDEDDLEIFPDGGELAMAISEDLWPDAIKYFSKINIQPLNNSYHSKEFYFHISVQLTIKIIAQAQEQDIISDEEFESMDEENGVTEYEDEEEKSRVAKKRKPN